MIGFATRGKPIQQREMSFLLYTYTLFYHCSWSNKSVHSITISTAQSDVVNAASHESDEINVSLVFIFNLFI